CTGARRRSRPGDRGFPHRRRPGLPPRRRQNLGLTVRIRLLPAGPLGWTPYAWLVYLATFLVEPVWRTQSGQAGTLYWAATALAVVVFLVAYFRGHWVHGSQLIPIIGVITAIGVISAPMNAGAAVMFVYAGSFAGYLD